MRLAVLVEGAVRLEALVVGAVLLGGLALLVVLGCRLVLHLLVRDAVLALGAILIHSVLITLVALIVAAVLLDRHTEVLGFNGRHYDCECILICFVRFV